MNTPAVPTIPPHHFKRVRLLMEHELMQHGPHLPPLPPRHERVAAALALIAAADAKVADAATLAATREED